MYYHGTSDIWLDKINKKGILPSEITGNKLENRSKNLNVVFLTDNPKFAKGYAIRACLKFGGNPIIIKVKSNPNINFERQEQFVAFEVKKQYILKIINLDIDISYEEMVKCFE